ncbi:MAG TPA: VOC family protein [Candidatus Didemnitutus sp.]|nr:VOC family protein [Candidatus Didemnitutus sp.]
MSDNFLSRLGRALPSPATLVVLALLLGGATSCFAEGKTFPALVNATDGEHHAGKFVWADLFTGDPATATKFYTSLFGWTAEPITQNGRSYTVFSSDGHPVAGLAVRKNSKRNQMSRWIAYVAVADLSDALASVPKAGGVVRAEARNLPDRGRQAIVTDSEGSPIGLLQSNSGETADDEPHPGEWNWFELYANDPRGATGFYHAVFGLEVKPDDRTARKNDYLLLTGDYPRAGVAPLPDHRDSQTGWLGVIRVKNIDETVSQVAKLGGEVLVAPRPVAYESRFAIISDPTGGTVGLVEYVDNANPATRP